MNQAGQMHILIILAHPTPGSFNHAIAQTVKKYYEDKGYEVISRDLYKEKFDPLITSEEIPKDGPILQAIQKHCNELESSLGIVIIHPNWWGQPPAILKGWIDRVLRPGVAYEFNENDSGEGVPNGLLKSEFAIVFNTSNTKEDREKTVFLDPLETIWKNCIFDLCGIKNFRRRMFTTIVDSTAEQRHIWLKEVADICAQSLTEIPANISN